MLETETDSTTLLSIADLDAIRQESQKYILKAQERQKHNFDKQVKEGLALKIGDLHRRQLVRQARTKS